MPKPSNPGRRSFLAAGAAAFLAGCKAIQDKDWAIEALRSAEWLTYRLHRLVIPNDKLAPEFSEAAISAFFKPNGSTDVQEASYQAHLRNGFADWRLQVGGLVDRPASFSLAELRAMPSRTQITRHDCVEGWSAIGKWKGVPLSHLLASVRLNPKARYIVFHCADQLDEGGPYYYESIDLVDAFHPQTILAYDMNGKTLPVPHGAPLRLRVERQLGYKMPKYVMRIEAVASFARLGGGRGGYWEDQGYDWYAGI